MENWKELKENVTIEFTRKTINIFNFHGNVPSSLEESQISMNVVQ
jgi:hypothetical protein